VTGSSPIEIRPPGRIPVEVTDGRRRVDLVVVVNGFPRLSETFVLQELLELERQGLRLQVVALRRPDEVVQQEALLQLEAEVEYLSDFADAAPKLAVRIAHAALLLRRPRSYLNGLAEVIASPDFSRRDLRRGLILAHRIARLGAPPLYLHFAHRPATVGRFAALLAGVPYGLSAHAKDIWLTPPRELKRKVRDAEVVLTCTSDGQRHLADLSGGETPVVLAYHGVETAGRRRQPANSGQPPVILSVGRLVEKKGHETLLQAVALLRDRGSAVRLRIVGEGAEWARLQRLVHELGLDERVTFTGPLSEAEVVGEYERAQVFALACRELENGDRDGIPNVVLEAMAHGLPIVSTSSPGILEAVTHEQSALLAGPGDAAGLADQLERVLLEPGLRERIGAGALAVVRERFDRSANLPTVLEALRSAGLVPGPIDEGEEPEEFVPLRAVS
jgi:glycosyltransferase involved in cell wall biosynthesis